MKRLQKYTSSYVVLAATIAILVATVVSPDHVTAGDRTALRTDLPAMVYGIAVENPHLGGAVVRPRCRRWSAQYGVSAFWSRAEGSGYLQLGLKALARRNLRSETRGTSGWYAALGAQTLWMQHDGNDRLTTVVIGPALEAGYRIAPGGGGFILEPYLGVSAVAGPRFSDGNTAIGSNAGVYGGVAIGRLLGG